jgi:hypothetical protein
VSLVAGTFNSIENRRLICDHLVPGGGMDCLRGFFVSDTYLLSRRGADQEEMNGSLPMALDPYVQFSSQHGY